MLNVTPLSLPAGAANGQKWRRSRNPPHAARIQEEVARSGTGERVTSMRTCWVPPFVVPVTEQPVTHPRRTVAASRIFAMDPLFYAQPAHRRPRASHAREQLDGWESIGVLRRVIAVGSIPTRRIDPCPQSSRATELCPSPSFSPAAARRDSHRRR